MYGLNAVTQTSKIAINYDSTILVRAIVVFAIVAGHFGFLKLAGGAFFERIFHGVNPFATGFLFGLLNRIIGFLFYKTI